MAAGELGVWGLEGQGQQVEPSTVHGGNASRVVAKGGGGGSGQQPGFVVHACHASTPRHCEFKASLARQ